MIDICELGETVYGKGNYKRYKSVLKNMVKENRFTGDVSDQIQAAQTAIVSSITAANTAALVVIMAS